MSKRSEISWIVGRRSSLGQVDQDAQGVVRVQGDVHGRRSRSGDVVIDPSIIGISVKDSFLLTLFKDAF